MEMNDDMMSMKEFSARCRNGTNNELSMPLSEPVATFHRLQTYVIAGEKTPANVSRLMDSE